MRWPQALYWSALVNRVYDGREGFAGLSPAERSYYAVSVLIGEVGRLRWPQAQQGSQSVISRPCWWKVLII
ncbi:hypothetical protein ACV330_30360, partial [Pseudomonas aeruginosa]